MTLHVCGGIITYAVFVPSRRANDGTIIFYLACFAVAADMERLGSLKTMDQSKNLKRSSHKTTVYSVASVAIGVALIAVCAFITVPGLGSMVPFTLQTFAVNAICALLGWRRGSASVAAYILLGAAGLPVFSGMRGGYSVLMGPTGGYIIGFLPMALIVGFMYEKLRSKRALSWISMLVGEIVMYAFGTAWFVIVYPNPISIPTALMMCVVPYIIPDIIKCVLALFVADRTYGVVNRKRA